MGKLGKNEVRTEGEGVPRPFFFIDKWSFYSILYKFHTFPTVISSLVLHQTAKLEVIMIQTLLLLS